MRLVSMNLVSICLIPGRMFPPRLFKPAMLLCLLVLTACASLQGSQSDVLTRNQYAWSGAIRWGDFEGAMNLIDPEYRKQNPITDIELDRYRQVQISAYRDLGASADMDLGTAARDIEIGVINRHTQAERRVRYREQWRWDAETSTWWLTTGLPDLWAGE